MKTILVPLDLSALTGKVLAAATDLAKRINARLALLHVTQPPPAMLHSYYSFDPGIMAGAVSAGEKQAHRKLVALGQNCRKKGLTVRILQRTGEPVTTILEEAAATRAAYIILGSHGHGAMFNLLVGSTTQGVLREARCPVIVIPVADQ